MSFRYDRLEFLELFDEEHFLDVQVGSVKYRLNLDGLFIFELYMLPCEEYAAVSLSYNKWEFLVFDVRLDQIDKVNVDKQKLGHVFINFYQEKSEKPVLRVLVKPTIAIQCNIDIRDFE